MNRSPSHHEIRRQFLEFFKDRCGHAVVPSAPVVPHEDPTLLFTNAGMNQFKDVFLGQGTRPYRRAADTQKCIRAGGKHNDLEDVGRDTYHHTFFEMLGNWSFGDYFKAEAIEWAWELLTKVYGLDPSRLYATYFGGDEHSGLAADAEARELWLRHLPPERVLPGSMKDNFWEMGDTGPCGPCSEIHFDRVGGRDAADLVNTGDPDVLEIWNLVFIQFNRESDGALKPLPAKHVDTGMGLERLVSVIAGARSNYDTDLFLPIFTAISQIGGARPYRGALEDPTDVAYRVVADHLRCLSIAIADGATPSNEGRGYVLRRILRRAVRFGHQQLGFKGTCLHRLLPAIESTLGEVFPELVAQRERIARVLEEEEKAFLRTLDRGLVLFAEAAERAEGGRIGGEDAFRLHDTYGFPIDLTEVMARERGLAIDLAGYESRMEAARTASRAGAAEEGDAFALPPDILAELERSGVHPTDDDPKHAAKPLRARVMAIWTGRHLEGHAETGETVSLIFDRTCFYAESGGQVGDSGMVRVEHAGHDGGREHGVVEVLDTRRCGSFVLHRGRVERGQVRVGDGAELDVDHNRRRHIASNHTATHLLNLALRQALDGESDQRGSLVDADRLRFDFASGRAMTPGEIAEVEGLVSDAIAEDLRVHAETAPLEAARSIAGVRAVFGERYPDPVRVVSIGAALPEMLAAPQDPRWAQRSIEFCGGTHVASTGEIGRFVLLSEQALAAGVRRIFALTGVAAHAAIAGAAALEERIEAGLRLDGEALAAEAADIAHAFESLPIAAIDRIRLQQRLEALRERVKEARKRSSATLREGALAAARELLVECPGAIVVGGVGEGDRDALMAAIDLVRGNRPEAAALLAAIDPEGGKVSIAAIVPAALIAKGLKAGEWVREVAKAVDGSGGGKPDSAQAGGKDPAKLPEAFVAAWAFAGSKLGHQYSRH
jgi:alanyl-tRNA synthetase